MPNRYDESFAICCMMLENFELTRQCSDYQLLLLVVVEEKQKSIDIESICELLDLVLGSEFRAQVDSFVQYLRVSLKYPCVFL